MPHHTELGKPSSKLMRIENENQSDIGQELSATLKNDLTAERECLTVVWALQKRRLYVSYEKLKMFTDRSAAHW